MACTRLRIRRRGMTLIELLVVIGILGILAITVVPNVVKSADSRRSREAARMVSTFITKAQSRAVGRRVWSGFAMTNVGSAAFDLSMSEVPDVFRGDTVPATLTITGSTTTTRTMTPSTGALAVSGTRFVAVNDLIRFDNRGPFFEISQTGTASIQFKLRGAMSSASEDAGYQPHNTPFPPANTPLTFEILRQPALSGSPVTMPEGMAIDLTWSGYGPPQVGGSNTYVRFAGNATVHVLFDGTGRLRQIVEGATRRAVTGTVFLLVGRAGRVGQASATPDALETTGANWQYPDSFWVAIDPLTGVAKSAECKPNATGSDDVLKCVDSQAWVRQALLADGR